jgi:hypothetical protein
MEHPKHNHSEAAIGHETRDARPLPVFIFAIGLLATLVLVEWLAWNSLRFLQRYEDSHNRVYLPAHPLSALMPIVPPDPRLQPEPSHDVLPPADLARVRAEEQAKIGPSAWGWVDPSHQFARIPVQEAIDLAVKQGLPEVLPATQPSAPSSMPPASAPHGPGGVP